MNASSEWDKEGEKVQITRCVLCSGKSEQVGGHVFGWLPSLVKVLETSNSSFDQVKTHFLLTPHKTAQHVYADYRICQTT